MRHPDRPGVYLLAVECDGAIYDSALWARERDRLRQDVLEHLGWRFHRVWSTDWFYDRRTQVERLYLALEAADTPADPAGANDAPPKGPAPEAAQAAIVASEAASRTMPAYVLARPWAASSGLKPHEAPMSMLAPLARQVVDVEGPVHLEEVARRLAAAFGKKNAGSRVLAAARHALLAARRKDPEAAFLIHVQRESWEVGRGAVLGVEQGMGFNRAAPAEEPARRLACR